MGLCLTGRCFLIQAVPAYRGAPYGFTVVVEIILAPREILHELRWVTSCKSSVIFSNHLLGVIVDCGFRSKNYNSSKMDNFQEQKYARFNDGLPTDPDADSETFMSVSCQEDDFDQARRGDAPLHIY